MCETASYYTWYHRESSGTLNESSGYDAGKIYTWYLEGIPGMPMSIRVGIHTHTHTHTHALTHTDTHTLTHTDTHTHTHTHTHAHTHTHTHTHIHIPGTPGRLAKIHHLLT